MKGLKIMTLRLSGAGRWTAGSAVVVLLSLAGLVALGPLDHELPGPEFGVCLGLDFGFWLGWTALIISFNCWVISRCSAAGRARIAAGAAWGGAVATR